MNEALKSLYDRFYIPLPIAEYEQEVETCHRQLIERLEKPERKLVRYKKPVPSGAGFLCSHSSLSFFTYSSLAICRAVKASFSSWACATCRFHSSTVICPRRFRAFSRL